MTINEYLRKYRKVNEFGMSRTRPRVKCADGYSVSVQAGYGLYSHPRVDADTYTHVELGFPSTEDYLLGGYAQDENRPLKTVYPFVPVDVVDALLARHGGIVESCMSNVSEGAWEGLAE